MIRGNIALLVAILLFVSPMVLVSPVAADNEPPTILDWGWDPQYPIDPQDVRLFARVTDADNVLQVQATWCTVPPLWCLFEDMTKGGSDTWEVLVPTDTYPPIIGASLQIHAWDEWGNEASTDYSYALFVDWIDLSFFTSVFEAEPRQSLTINGTAFYEGNLTAPAEGLTVEVTMDGLPLTTTVDASGSFSFPITAPSDEGTYSVAAHMEDRTLVAEASATLAVSVTPRPDLTIVDARLASAQPVAGEPLGVTFRARNIGSESASNVRVLVEVFSGTAPTQILDERISIPRGGAEVPLVASWSPTAGDHTVRITIDPDGEIEELNEGNNVAELTVAVRASSDEGGGLLLWAAAAIGIVVAVASVVTVFVIFRRRKVG